MIALQHNITNEVQFVATLDGIDLDLWTEIDGGPVLLAEAKAKQRGIINRARDAAIDGGAETPAGVVDTNATSRILIAGAAQTAVIAASAEQPFEVDWTLADNSVATLDGAEMIGLGLAVSAHVGAMHSRGRVLKARIDDAETVEAVAAIGWTLVDPE
jgi:hypothetical protein